VWLGRFGFNYFTVKYTSLDSFYSITIQYTPLSVDVLLTQPYLNAPYRKSEPPAGSIGSSGNPMRPKFHLYMRRLHGQYSNCILPVPQMGSCDWNSELKKITKHNPGVFSEWAFSSLCLGTAQAQVLAGE